MPVIFMVQQKFYLFFFLEFQTFKQKKIGEMFSDKKIFKYH